MRRFLCAVAVVFAAFLFATCDDSKDDVVLSSISVAEKPAAVYYCLGDAFDATGVVVTAHYSDGSSKDVSDLVEISGFDSSAKKENVPITLLYTDGGVSRTATLYVTVADYPVAKSRVVKVSFQYYKRESEFDDSADAFKPYTYSDDAADDVNGSVTFYINEKGMQYSVTDLVYCTAYYPSSKKTLAQRCVIHYWNVKPTKYFSDDGSVSTITIDTLEGSSFNSIPYSYLFSYLADNLVSDTFRLSNSIERSGAKLLLFEDLMLNGQMTGTFNGAEYPAYERDEQGNITKGTVLKFVNPYYRCVLAVETAVQDVHIAFPEEIM